MSCFCRPRHSSSTGVVVAVEPSSTAAARAVKSAPTEETTESEHAGLISAEDGVIEEVEPANENSAALDGCCDESEAPLDQELLQIHIAAQQHHLDVSNLSSLDDSTSTSMNELAELSLHEPAAADQPPVSSSAVISHTDEERLSPTESLRLAKRLAEARVQSAVDGLHHETPPPALPNLQPPPPQSSSTNALLHESGQLLEFLRKEVLRLRQHNHKLTQDLQQAQEHHQRLVDANASAATSFATLGQHTRSLQHDLQQTHVQLAEVQDQVRLQKQAYIGEVQMRVQYETALKQVVDLVQQNSRQPGLVDQVLAIAEACEVSGMEE